MFSPQNSNYFVAKPRIPFYYSYARIVAIVVHLLIISEGNSCFAQLIKADGFAVLSQDTFFPTSSNATQFLVLPKKLKLEKDKFNNPKISLLKYSSSNKNGALFHALFNFPPSDSLNYLPANFREKYHSNQKISLSQLPAFNRFLNTKDSIEFTFVKRNTDNSKEMIVYTCKGVITNSGAIIADMIPQQNAKIIWEALQKTNQQLFLQTYLPIKILRPSKAQYAIFDICQVHQLLSDEFPNESLDNKSFLNAIERLENEGEFNLILSGNEINELNKEGKRNKWKNKILTLLLDDKEQGESALSIRKIERNTIILNGEVIKDEKFDAQDEFENSDMLKLVDKSSLVCGELNYALAPLVNNSKSVQIKLNLSELFLADEDNKFFKQIKLN